jgi:hypothetical protein
MPRTRNQRSGDSLSSPRGSGASQAFGDPDEDEEELSPDSQLAAEAATLDDQNAELASGVCRNLTADQRERFCKVVRDLFA